MDAEDGWRWTHELTAWVESTLLSLVVHMVLMILLGLVFSDMRHDLAVEIVSAQTESVPIEVMERVAPVVAKVESSPTLLAGSINTAQTNVSEQLFSLAGAASTTIAIPDDIGTFDRDTQRLAGKLLEGSGNGIGDLLGGAFGDRLGRAGAGTGAVQFSLIWDNFNDLDLHVVCPSTERISYLHPRSKCGGFLDVDMNAGGRTSDEPVENVFWSGAQAPRGVYRVYVIYYARRDPNVDGSKFQVAIKVDNRVETFTGEVNQQKREVLVGSFARRYAPK